jgi:hypothetical protein
MKVIVAGGRDVDLTEEDKQYLIDKVKDGTITTLVSGMASGIDIQSHDLLKEIVPIDPYPALWDDLTAEPCLIKYNKFGKAYNACAGNNRNLTMAQNAEALIVFEGGRGSRDMLKTSKKLGLKIIDNFMEVLY